MGTIIRVGILDNYQGAVEVYLKYLAQDSQIEVVGIMQYGEELEPFLENVQVDVLILDVQVATALDDPNLYPLLHLIPKLLQQYPRLFVLAISMHNQSTLIKAFIDIGISGYILKDDRTDIQKLDKVIRTIAQGEKYFGEHVSL